MSQNVPAFHWSAKTERAAALLAEDALDDAAIAKECGVERRTIVRWKRHPAFIARIAEHVTAQREALKAEGIANRQNRVAILQAEMDDMQALRAARRAAGAARAAAERTWHEEEHPDTPYMPAAPGIETGLLVRTETPTRYGTVVEYTFDRALQDEQRATLKQVSQELGQWEERTHETVGADADFLAALRSFGADDGRGGGPAPDPKPA